MLKNDIEALTEPSIAEEQRAYAIWASHYPYYAIVETDKARPAMVDALITYESGLYAVVEVKSRTNLTRHKLQNEYGNKLLLMRHKLINCQRIASNLQTRFIVFYYLRDEDVLVVQGIQHLDGVLTTNIDYGDIHVGLTNLETNKVKQAAAFVDLNNAKFLRMKESDTPTTSP
jgi:hypothetical protein